MQIEAHRFAPRDLRGGHAVLDLVNTVTARNAEPIDWLDGYARLLEWARLGGSFDDRTLRELELLRSRDPAAAEEALRRLRALRELLVGMLTALIHGNAVSPGDAARLEREWKEAVAHARLEAAAGCLRPELSVERSGVDFPRHALALRALDLLDALPLDRTRICPGSHCGWLFVDHSRGGKRRWCDMATCGNLEKSRRHYARHRRPDRA